MPTTNYSIVRLDTGEQIAEASSKPYAVKRAEKAAAEFKVQVEVRTGQGKAVHTAPDKATGPKANPKAAGKAAAAGSKASREVTKAAAKAAKASPPATDAQPRSRAISTAPTEGSQKCEVCKEKKGLTKFPTINGKDGTRRGTECRACRAERIGRGERKRAVGGGGKASRKSTEARQANLPVLKAAGAIVREKALTGEDGGLLQVTHENAADIVSVHGTDEQRASLLGQPAA